MGDLRVTSLENIQSSPSMTTGWLAYLQETSIFGVPKKFFELYKNLYLVVKSSYHSHKNIQKKTATFIDFLPKDRR